MSKIEEDVLVDILQLAVKWGCPFQLYDIQVIVRDYLNLIPLIVPVFKNMPRDDWVRSFIYRHKTLQIKFAENIKRSRAEVSRETMETYFKNIKTVIDDPNHPIEPRNLVIYDETAFVDDPGKKKCVVRTGARAENVTDHTKTSSVMFAAAASGNLLPPYIVYKTENMMMMWTEGGLAHSSVVLQTIPHTDDEIEIGKRFLEPVSRLLHAHRIGEKPKLFRHKKVNTPAGKSVALEDFQEGSSVEEEDVNDLGSGLDSNDDGNHFKDLS